MKGEIFQCGFAHLNVYFAHMLSESEPGANH